MATKRTRARRHLPSWRHAKVSLLGGGSFLAIGRMLDDQNLLWPFTSRSDIRCLSNPCHLEVLRTGMTTLSWFVVQTFLSRGKVKKGREISIPNRHRHHFFTQKESTMDFFPTSPRKGNLNHVNVGRGHKC
jgi:hypothetical protein